VKVQQRATILKRAGDPKTRRSPVIIAHAVFLCVGMVLMLGIKVGFSLKQGRLASVPDPISGFRPAARNGLARPSGELHYLPLALSRPDAFFTNLSTVSQTTHWVVNKKSDDRLAELIESLGLDGPARKFLGNRAHWRQEPGGYAITPPAEIVLGLRPEARQRFYAFLGLAPENIAQQKPFRFPAEAFAEWFADSGLAPEKIELFRELSYTNADTICFADAATFAQLSAPEETTLLIKALSRVPTFMLKLHVDPEAANLEPIERYWGKFASRDSRLLLKSLARSADSDITISYFLPPFARLRLYTYPRPDEPRSAEQNDIWTAMNFFNKQPDDRFLDQAYAEKTLSSAEYVRVATRDRQFGDTIVFVAQQSARRMCVYMADDFVFTKRAPGMFEPWLLMQISELIADSQADRPFEIRVYRHQPAPVVDLDRRTSADGGKL
jgi:hypothetical protein